MPGEPSFVRGARPGPNGVHWRVLLTMWIAQMENEGGLHVGETGGYACTATVVGKVN
jgi:hypothetical protein